MKELLNQAPRVLLRLAILKVMFAVGLFIAFVAICVLRMELSFGAPVLLFAFLFLIQSGDILNLLISGNYLYVTGQCTSIVYHKGKRIKHLEIQYNDKRLIVTPRGTGLGGLLNKQVTVYLSPKTPVYESGGCYYVYDYLAIESPKEMI